MEMARDPVSSVTSPRRYASMASPDGPASPCNLSSGEEREGEDGRTSDYFQERARLFKGRRYSRPKKSAEVCLPGITETGDELSKRGSKSIFNRANNFNSDQDGLYESVYEDETVGHSPEGSIPRGLGSTHSLPPLHLKCVDVFRGNFANGDGTSSIGRSSHEEKIKYDRDVPSVCGHQLRILPKIHSEINRRLEKEKRNRSSNKCVLCGLSESSSRIPFVDVRKLLVDSVYPHEFYDRFSRVSIVEDREERNKQLLDISRPIKAIARESPRPKSPPPPPTSAKEVHSTIEGDKRYTCPSYLDPHEKKTCRQHQGYEADVTKKIHVQCRPKLNPAVITDGSECCKLTPKGLKGWLLKKAELPRDAIHNEMKKSLYEVQSLGLSYGIPEYNGSLQTRRSRDSPMLQDSRSPSVLSGANSRESPRTKLSLPPIRAGLRQTLVKWSS